MGLWVKHWMQMFKCDLLTHDYTGAGTVRETILTQAGLDPEEYAKTLDSAYGVACCYSSRQALKRVLKRLKELDAGISIVVSGLIDEIVDTAKDLGLKPHTAFLSLGIHGRRALLPENHILEITTMCGHGLVSEKLTRAVLEKVKSGDMTPAEGANHLAQPCPCGIFNTDRFEELAKIYGKSE